MSNTIKVAGRGLLYILPKPITLTEKEYNSIKWNPNVGIEVEELLIDPPLYRIRGITYKRKHESKPMPFPEMEFKTDDPKSKPMPFPEMEFKTDKTIKSI